MKSNNTFCGDVMKRFSREENQASWLHLAVNARKWGQVVLQLQHGADVNVIDGAGRTPLHLAIERGAPTYIVTPLISKENVNMLDMNNDSSLHLALRFATARWGIVTILLQNEADVNVFCEKDHVFPLLYALKKNAPKDIIIQLISPQTINFMDVNGDTALHIAIRDKRWDLVSILLQRGANVNTLYRKSDTPVSRLICERQWDLVREALQHGADIHFVDGMGRAAFHWAIGSGCDSLDLLLRLISTDTINNMVNQCYTALHFALQSKQWEVVRFLMEHGADFNVVSILKRTPLNNAIRWKAPDDICIGLITPENINTADGRDISPLHRTIWNRNWKLVSVLIHHGADVNLVDCYRKTPLHRALHVPDAPIDIVKLLISPENINIRYADGDTPLHLAVNFNRWEFVTHLLNRGADVNVVDIDGQTPLHLSIIFDAPADIVMQMISPQNVDMMDSYGETALHLLASQHKWNLVHTLLHHGADPTVVEGFRPQVALTDLCITTIRSHMPVKTDEALEQLELPRCLIPEMKLIGLAQQFIAWWKNHEGDNEVEDLIPAD